MPNTSHKVGNELIDFKNNGIIDNRFVLQYNNLPYSG